MKNLFAYILSIILVLFIVTDCYSDDIIIDDINLSGTLGPGIFITDHNLFVDFTDTLTIAPGTTIKFSENTSLTVNGCLISVATPGLGIVFTSVGPTETWIGINFPSAKNANMPADQVWKSKIKRCSFENVSGQGAINYTCNSAFRAIDSISYCSFSNSNNAVFLLFATQSSIVINNNTFSSIQNTAITIGNTAAGNIQVYSNTLNELSDRFLYLYSNTALTSLGVNINTLDNLSLDKSTIRLDNNLSLNSLFIKNNNFRNFTADAEYPVDESIVYCKDLDGLNSLLIQSNTIGSIFDEQDLTSSIKSFFFLEYGKTISLKSNMVKNIKNLKHFFFLGNSESLTAESCEFDTVYCDTALFRIVAQKSCKFDSGLFNNIITNSGNGCLYFDQVSNMDGIVLNNNHFETITADNGPCLNINSLSGSIDSVVFSNNIIEQNRIGFFSKNGGVAYLRLATVGKFRTSGNTIRNCIVTNYGGVYYFDAGTISNIEVKDDDLNYIEANNNGGYISVKNTTNNESLIINNLTVDSCFSDMGTGGIVYLVSQNNNVGRIKINQCKLNYFHAGDEATHNNGGGFYLKGNYKNIYFTENQFVQDPGEDEYPVAGNGGILYFGHTGTSLDTAVFSGNAFSKADSLIVSGSGAAVYMTGQGDVKYFSFDNNGFTNFHAAGNGGCGYFKFNGKCDALDLGMNDFSACIADTSGGSLYFSSNGIGRLTIEGSDADHQTFINSKAKRGSGGSVYINSASQAISHIEIRYNEIQSADAGNIALDGGGMYIKSAGTQVGHLSLANNFIGDETHGLSAGGNGGAFCIDLQGRCDTLNILNNFISKCKANGSGGAVYFKSAGIGNLSIMGEAFLSQDFTDCQAVTGSGGALYINSLSQSIDNINILFNDAQSAQNLVNAAGNGGFLFIKAGGALVNNVYMISNTLGDSQHGLSAKANGGAVYFDMAGKCDTLIVFENSFMNAVADTSGGAIFFRSAGINYMNVSGDVGNLQAFRNCRATKGSGGSLYISSLSQPVGAADFLYNDIQATSDDKNSGADGGGFYVKSTNGDVEFVHVKKNNFGSDTRGIKAGVNGGALYFEFPGKCNVLNVSNNTFNNCQATGGSGGALYFKSNGIGDLLVKGTSELHQAFKNCKAQAGSGGALYVNGLSKAVENTDIQFNDILTTESAVNATVDGGGIYIKSGDQPVSKINVNNNTAGNDSFGLSAGGNGGAYYFELAGACDSVGVKDNTTKNCSAHVSGGGIYLKAAGIGTLAVKGAENALQTFKNCKAETGSGGAVYVNTTSQTAGSASVVYNDFQSSLQVNNAGEDGGAFYLKTAGALVDQLTIANNKAGNTGSGIKAGGNGGAFYVELPGTCSNFGVTDNYFSKCTSGGSGGAVYFSAAGTDILDIAGSSEADQVFSYCEAGDDGGALLFKSNSTGQAGFADNSFSHCSAVNGGAVSIYSNSISDLALTTGKFDYCGGSLNGGSLYLAGVGSQAPSITSLQIGNCSFNHSVSTAGKGGAVYYTGNIADFSCHHSSFLYNACNSASSGFGAAVYFDLKNEITNNLQFTLDTIRACSSASGAIYLANFNVAGFGENQFVSNTADENGAALYVSDFDTLTVSNSLFGQNKSDAAGGAVFIDSGASDQSYVKIEYSDIEFNTSIKGGALSLSNFSSADILNNNFIQNTGSDSNLGSDTRGGAIFSDKVNFPFITNNTFLRNTAFAPEDSDLQSYGGSVSVSDHQKLTLLNNEFYFSEAKVGGALYAENTGNTAGTEILDENNMYFQNMGLYGGAVYCDLKEQDVINSTENIYLNNQAAYSGGAVDLRHMDVYNSTRNIFRDNINEGQSSGNVIGASAMFTLGVAKVHLYNSVFDYNSYSEYSGLEKAPTAWFKNHDSVTIENCTFRDQIQQDRPVICKEGNSDPVFISNSIFKGNLNTTTPITNDNALISYSFIEGVITAAIDTSHCFAAPAPVFVPDSYILNDNDTDFIDAGNPDPLYNDSIDYPIGKGQQTCDLGVSGGRYNIWDDEEQLEIPVLTSFTRTLIIERYNGQCGWYRIYFALQQGDVFNDYTWYVNDQVFNTDAQNELIEFFPENMLLSVTGVARNSTTGMVVMGNNSINTMNEITCSGSVISYAGSEYQCDDEIVINDQCPEGIENLSVSLLDLNMPYFASYKYNWSFSDQTGILNNTVIDDSYNSISFSLDLIQDTTVVRNITVEYSAMDTVCDISFNYSCKINLRYPNMAGNLHMTGISAEGTELDPNNAYLELSLNVTPFYCSGNNFYQLAEGSIDPSLGIVSITPAPSGTPVAITSIEYTGSSLVVHPEMTSFGKGDYIISLSNLCNMCGFPASNESRQVSIMYIGIDEPWQGKVSIWPNPANDKVFIGLKDQNVKVQAEIINSIGTIVQKETLLPASSHVLDVSGLPAGIYTLRLYALNSTQIFNQKLIIE
jgi:hypothetical protein